MAVSRNALAWCWSLLIVGAVPFASPAYASGSGEVRSLRAVRVGEGSIEVDGLGNDAAWAAAERATGFVQRDPAEGRGSSESTQVAVVYDSEALYVLIEARDSHPEQIRGQMTSRDEWNPSQDRGRAFRQHSDFVEVWLAPQNDGLTAYAFTVSAAGIQVDARYSSAGTTKDPVWNGVWDSAVSRSQLGWSAELRVPFSQLRYDPDASSWGLQFVRYLHRENEISVFSPTPKSELRPLSYMGLLQGIRGLPPSRSLELTPYAAAALERRFGETSFRARAGGDARIVLGAASVLQLSIIPDFGQVEQDPSQLNLTAYEIFRTERRQFFVDGQELFTYSLFNREATNETLYYSRRIGAQPVVTAAPGVEVLDNPRETTILAAAKFIGRSSAGFGYSALTAFTGRETARIRVDGAELEPVVASPTNYSVLRLRQELGGGSSIGAVATNVYRFLDEDLATPALEMATTAAVDVDLRLGDFGLVGNAVGSRVAGAPSAVSQVQTSSAHYFQRPDATHLRYDPTRTEMLGYAFGVNAGKLSGRPLLAWAGLQVRDPYFEANDLGYLRVADQQSVYANLGWRQDTPTSVYRNFGSTLTAWTERTFGNEVTGRGVMLDNSMTFANSWIAYLGATRRAEALDVALLRGGPAFLKPGGFGAWWGVGTDARQPFSLLAEGSGDYDDNDSLAALKLSLKFSIRPYSALSLSLLPAYQVSVNDLQYVDTADTGSGPEPILGRLAQNTVSVTLRLSWALAPGLTIEAYAMPFLTAGKYDRFYSIGDPRAERYAERRIVNTAYAGAREFLAAEVRSNTVLRWDYMPGSTIYLAWAHEQSRRRDVGELQAARDLKDLLMAPSLDIVFLKWAHYFDI